MVSFRSIIAFSIIVVLCCVLAGCIGETSPANGTQTSSTQTSSTQGDLSLIANTISAGFGEITLSNSENSLSQIIVFPETHDSRAMQIETAIMLNRMQAQGMQNIALEGSFENEHIKPDWFHVLTNSTIKNITADKLLKEGEISNAEFISLVYPNINVEGIEKSDEYSLSIPEEASSSPTLYLLAIAETSMTSEEISHANALYKSGGASEAIDYIINSDPWTKTQYEKMEQPEKILNDLEGELTFYRGFISKANEVDADIDTETKENFEKFISFIEARNNASKTISNNALKLSQSSPNVPTALIIGSAHTKSISDSLTTGKAAFVVINPISLSKDDDISDLSSEAFYRKYSSKSVDEQGLLGSYLTKKPRPFLTTPAAESKTKLYYVATVLSNFIAGGGSVPPYPDDLNNVQSDNFNLDPESIIVDGDDVIFKATVRTIDNQDQDIYTRVTTNIIGNDDLEVLLKKAHDDVLDINYINQENKMRKEHLIEITPGTIASCSPDKYPEKFVKSS